MAGKRTLRLFFFFLALKSFKKQIQHFIKFLIAAGEEKFAASTVTGVENPSSKMKGQDLELEKARLLSLATRLGFDEESAKKCLDRFVDLYGTKSDF